MARTRLLSPKFFLDDDLAERSAYARLTFAGLILIADREGRLDDRPKVISAELFPFEDVDMDALLDELAATRNGSGGGGFILRYQVNGRRYLEIRNFLKYQTPHFREACSAIPPPSYKPEPRAEPRAEPEAEQPCMDPVMYGSGMDPVSVPEAVTEKPSSKSFWWDPELKRVLGAVKAFSELEAKWLERGLTLEEFRTQIAACNRWLQDRPPKRREGSNFANRMNNWLNTYLTDQEGRARGHPKSAAMEHSEPQHYDAPINPEITARHHKREEERLAKLKAWREEKPPAELTALQRMKWREEHDRAKP